MFVEVAYWRIAQLKNESRLVLREIGGKGRILSMSVDDAIGKYIGEVFMARPFPQPLLPDILKTAIETAGGKVIGVSIAEIRNKMCWARIVFEQGSNVYCLPASPPDAIALALRVPDCPIYVEDEFLNISNQDLARQIEEIEARTAAKRDKPDPRPS